MNNVTTIILNKKIDGKCWQDKLDITCLSDSFNMLSVFGEGPKSNTNTKIILQPIGKGWEQFRLSYDKKGNLVKHRITPPNVPKRKRKFSLQSLQSFFFGEGPEPNTKNKTNLVPKGSGWETVQISYGKDGKLKKKWQGDIDSVNGNDQFTPS